MSTRPNLKEALETLQPFQRRTVDHVVRRLLDKEGSGRFLVADEVGLGKTLVARGVVAKFIERNWDGVERIDVIYLCSNAALARENLAKLRVHGNLANTLPATRFTLLPRELHKLQGSKLNFISLTPDTALNVKGGGLVDERRVLFQILRAEFEDGAWLSNFFQHYVDTDRWRESVRTRENLDAGLSTAFLKNLKASPDLLKRFNDMRVPFTRINGIALREAATEQYRLLGDLRALLAKTCIEALQPDLIILDEFQRFKDLLTPKTVEGELSSVAELAQQLFEYKTPENNQVATLLLSATPYRMFTTADEAVSDDHYTDFLETLRFLLRNGERFEMLKSTLMVYREQLSLAAHGLPHTAENCRDSLQEQLLRVMVRTERVGSSVDRDSMVLERCLPAPLQADDLKQYLATETLRNELDGHDVIELWKSSPYLLNFMKKYQLKENFDEKLGRGALQKAFAKSADMHLSEKQVQDYERIDPGNARLRVLQQECLGQNQWKMLWLPPSHPYWPLRGAWAENAHFTKKLVFSAWNVVPDAISGLLSYEAERLQMGEDSDKPAYKDLKTKRSALLRYSLDGERPQGMTTLALQLPCLKLASIHPLSFPEGSDPEHEMLGRVRELLAGAQIQCGEGKGDPSWYWATLLLLEEDQPALRAFLAGLRARESVKNSGDDSDDHQQRHGHKGLSYHVQEAERLLDDRVELGSVPHDLAEVLADFALGSPSVVWARTLGQFGVSEAKQRSEGNNLGEAFRTLFNSAAVVQMLHNKHGETYWRSTLRYCIDGNLQALLDEYAHFLWEPAMWGETSADAAASSITETARSAVTAKEGRVRPDYYTLGDNSIAKTKEGVAFRTHFALRYGNQAASGQTADLRDDAVRDAFKSPFYPFVLASTSVGQEGLDFHPWCHAVWHWNLPGNPVDLEQREGRVHRYKGHAVRKNVAEHGQARLRTEWNEKGGDPWELLFEMAKKARPEGASDLVPCWVAPGQHKVERCVPLLPFSREIDRFENLKRSLAIYRVVFGQPRQEELLKLLAAGQVSSEELQRWVMRLEPQAVNSLPVITEVDHPFALKLTTCDFEIEGAERERRGC